MPEDGFGVGFYSPKVAARVAKVKYQQFQAWAKAHLLHAEKFKLGARAASVYSYNDLLLIRLVVRLRERGFTTKKIHRALETIVFMSGGDPHGWLRATIAVAEGLIVAVISGQEQWSPAAVSRGPQKLAVIFFPELVEELRRELVPDRFRYIEIDPEILAGAPVIKGTRIPTKAVVVVKQGGQDPREAYPALTVEQIQDAEAYEEFLEVA